MGQYRQILRHLPPEAQSAYIHARMSGIEGLYSSRPCSTLLDAEVFLKGWADSEKFQLRTLGIVSETPDSTDPSSTPMQQSHPVQQ